MKEKKKVEKIEKIKQEDISSKHAIENKEDVKETGLENITAFVGTNDFVAIGIMDAITSLGYRIPEDFSVCGFDNTLVASFSGISCAGVSGFSAAASVSGAVCFFSSWLIAGLSFFVYWPCPAMLCPILAAK